MWLYNRKNARLKFIKFQSGTAMLLHCHLSLFQIQVFFSCQSRINPNSFYFMAGYASNGVSHGIAWEQSIEND